MYYECRSVPQICADVFLGSLPHKDIGIGKVNRVAGYSKLTGLFDWELKGFKIGLSGVHPDKSVANTCKLRQWRSPQPSRLASIVLDDSLPAID